MESKAKFLGHAIHPMLIVFPLGLLLTSIVFDWVYFFTENGRWADISFWMITAGIIGGLAASVFGLIDWIAIPRNTRAKSVGLWHGVGNVFVLVLFGVSWFLRFDAPEDPGVTPLVISLGAAALSGVTAWLGGELVDRLGIGVDEGAHVNSPSSLSGQPAIDRRSMQASVGTGATSPKQT